MRSLLLLTTLFVAGFVHAEDARDVNYWISRMGEALRTEDYAGVFTYMRGQQFDTVEIVHRFDDGVEKERLLYLNGEHREITRNGDEIFFRHADAGRVEPSYRVPLGPFTNGFNQSLANFQSFYDVTLGGRDRVAGRSAVRLAVTPKYGDRWGYRLWLDEETGLLLQSHLVGRGKVLEVFQFTNVEIGRAIEDGELETTLPDALVVHELTPIKPPEVAPVEETKPQWRVSWVPNGFRQVASPIPDRIVFSDGIATFSVFIETSAATNDFGTLMGGTAVIMRQIKGSSQKITIVGEVPMDTAQRVAESIEPVIY